MRIAFLVDKFPLISETFVLAQITGMIDRGHDVTIFARQLVESNAVHEAVSRYRLLDKTVRVPFVARNPLGRLTQAMRAIRRAATSGSIGVALRALNFVRFGREALGLSLLVRATPYFGASSYDIIHCQFGQLGIGAMTLKQCGALKGDLVTSFRGTDAMQRASSKPGAFQNLFDHGEKFLAVSHAVRQRLIDLGCPVDRIDVLRSGIDLSRFRARASRDLHSPIRLVSVGRLAPNKGISYALRAVRLLRDAGYDVHYRIVGDGPSRSSLNREVAELTIDSVVTFEGAVDSSAVIEILRESDILVTPSITGPDGEQEGLPNSPKEAMAIGVLAIGTRVGGTPELIQDDVNGYLVGEQDPTAIASCIESVVNNWSSTSRIIDQARQTVESDYDIDSLHDALEGTYRELLAES